MAYSVCCTDLLVCPANTPSRICRILVRKVREEKSIVEYFQRARSAVPNKRSVDSGKVVSESFRNPANSDPAVFIMTRFSSPDQTDDVPSRARNVSEVWSSPLDCTNVVG